jgi:hypothetical protein
MLAAAATQLAAERSVVCSSYVLNGIVGLPGVWFTCLALRCLLNTGVGAITNSWLTQTGTHTILREHVGWKSVNRYGVAGSSGPLRRFNPTNGNHRQMHPAAVLARSMRQMLQ